MTKMLENLINDSCLIYLDDVISFGSSLKDMINALRKFFKELLVNILPSTM